MNGVAVRLSFAQAASGVIGGAATPFFGAWLAWRGMAPAEIGAIMAAGMLLRVFVAPVSGMIADARNDRRAMMLGLYAVMLVSYASLNFVKAHPLIALASIAAAVAGGATSPLMESVTIRLADRYGFDYGRVRLWCSTLFVAGNIVSGLAVQRFGLIVIAPWLTVALVWNLTAVYLLPKPPADRPRGDFGLRLRATLAEAHELVRSPVFIVFLLAASLDQGSHAFYYAYGGLHWTKLGYSGGLIGILWPLGVFAEIALMSVSLKVFRALGSTRLLLFGALGCVLRWTILAFDPPLPFVVFAQILHGATFALAHLGAMYFILKAVPPRLAATGQSLYAVCSSGLAMGLATLASGPLYAVYGGRTYLLMSAMGVGAAVFALLLGALWNGAPITQRAADEVFDTI
jgi:PPP family 3-phenylpropionic acid transporter